MISNEQRKQLSGWFRCSIENSKTDALRESALQFAKSIMDSMPEGPDQDNALSALRLAWLAATAGVKR